jgi:hypothetical protein
MNITVSVEETLATVVRKIAIERNTTLTELVRVYLQDLAADHAHSRDKHVERDELERSFGRFQFHVGKRTWRREQLHDRR